MDEKLFKFLKTVYSKTDKAIEFEVLFCIFYTISARTYCWSTFYKCISTHALWTSAHRYVINYVTDSIYSACIDARIYTFITLTTLV